MTAGGRFVERPGASALDFRKIVLFIFILFLRFRARNGQYKKILNIYYFFIGAPTNVGYPNLITTTIVGANCYGKEKVKVDEP